MCITSTPLCIVPSVVLGETFRTNTSSARINDRSRRSALCTHNNPCKTCKEHCCIGDYGTFLTLRDAERISKHLKKDIEDFCFYGDICQDKQGQEELMKDKDHSYFEYCDNGKVLQLKSKNNKECIFLENKKCVVYPVRPLICQIFPIGFRKINRKLKLFIEPEDKYCKITKKESLNHILKFLGCTKQKALSLINKFLKEIKEYKEYSKDFEKKSPNLKQIK